jgi:hypothetical protein
LDSIISPLYPSIYKEKKYKSAKMPTYRDILCVRNRKPKSVLWNPSDRELDLVPLIIKSAELYKPFYNAACPHNVNIEKISHIILHMFSKKKYIKIALLLLLFISQET